MKREAVHHSKMKRLCRRLELETWQAIGLLEAIWHVTARQTPRGDIGKLSDEDIAVAIDYRGDERKMLGALIDSGWLDRNQDHRLLVHDWPDHAEDGVHMKVARAREFFIRQSASGETFFERPNLARLQSREREPLLQFYEDFEKRNQIVTRAHAVRTDRPNVRTDQPNVRTKGRSVRETPPRPRLDPLTPESSETVHTTLQPSSSAAREVGLALGLDDDAAARVISKTAQTDPAVSIAEIIELGRIKKSQVRGNVENWPGLLVTSIPKMAAGAPLATARKNLNGHVKHAAVDKTETRRVAQAAIDDPKSTPEERKLAHELLEGLKSN